LNNGVPHNNHRLVTWGRRYKRTQPAAEYDGDKTEEASVSRFDQNRTPYRHRLNWAASQNTGGQTQGGQAFVTRSVDYVIDLAHCESRKVLRLNAYWHQMTSGGSAMPSRQNIEPGKIRDLLANIMIIELHDDPLRLRYRLVGTAVSAAMGRDVTGKWLEDVIEDRIRRDKILAMFDTLRRQHTPIFGQTIDSRERHGCHNYHWAIFPLSNDGEHVSHALMIEDYDNAVAHRTPSLTTD
jgi:hypothetical protein